MSAQATPKVQKRNLRRRWTAADDATLAELRESGYSNAQIAKQLGRTAKATQYRVQVLALPARATLDKTRCRWTREDDGLLRLLVATGTRSADIAARLGRSTASIDARRDVLGLCNTRPGAPTTAHRARSAASKARYGDLMALWDAANLRVRQRLEASP